MFEKDVRIALENYHFYFNALQETMWDLEKLNAIRYDHAGGSIAKMPENPRDKGEVITDNLQKAEALTIERDRYQHNVKLVEHFMSKIRDDGTHRDRQMMTDWYIRNKSIRFLEINYHMSFKTIYRRRDYIIRKYVEEMNKMTTLTRLNGLV